MGIEETKLKRKLKQVQKQIDAAEKGEEVEQDLEELKVNKQRIFDDLEYIKVNNTSRISDISIEALKIFLYTSKF